MLDLLTSPLSNAFDDFTSSIQSECFLCSPYITMPPVRHLLTHLRRKNLCETLQLQVLTDISAQNIINGSTDLAALKLLAKAVPCLQLYYLPRVHAKVFLADRSTALIGSANFTDGGKSGNYEYTVRLRDQASVERIWQDMSRYAGLGALVKEHDLNLLQSLVEGVRQETRSEIVSLREKMRPITETLRSEVLLRCIEDSLVEIRVAERTIHAIFCDTTLYLLNQRQMTAEEMADFVKQLHPDICNERNYIIKGQSFGKKWKHHLRSARGTLQRKNMIKYHSDLDSWSLC